jgi:L-threonylcarbamoyladenylate synthase
MAIVSTSANTSTRPALRSAAAVNRCFGDQIDAIVDGVIGQFTSPSTITNAITGEKVRL